MKKKQLFKIEAHITLYVFADSYSDAHAYADDNVHDAVQDGGVDIDLDVEGPIDHLNDVDSEWRDAIPYGIGPLDEELTVAEFFEKEQKTQ